MVQRILRTLESSVRGLSKEIRSLHQAAYLLAALTLASQVLALLRDRVFAHSFGASEALDVYYAAFKIPDLVFALIASLVSAYVLIPRIAGREAEQTRRLLSHATSFLLIAGGVVACVLLLSMPSVLSAVFPTLMQGAYRSEFVMLAQLLLIQPLLLGLSGILTSVTQVERRFTLFALSPVLYNLGIILGTVVLYPVYGLVGIGVGVVTGALAHLALHIPVLLHAKVMPGLVLPSLKEIGSLVRDSIPRSLALSFGALSALTLASLASTTGEGAVALFSLAGNLEAVPLALIGASYATAAFPVLAEDANRGHSDAFRATLIAAGRHLLFWASVVAVLAIVLRAHLVRVVYGTGAFDWDATRLTAALLAVLIVGLAAQCFVLLSSRAFYALGKSWTPFLIQGFGFIASVAGAYGLLALARMEPELLVFVEVLLRVEGVVGSEVVLIALGATLGQLLMGVVSLFFLARLVPSIVGAYTRPFLEGSAAGIVGGVAAYGVLDLMGGLAPLTTFWSVFTQGTVAGMVGLITAGALLVLLENREFRDLASALLRISGAKALSPSGLSLHDRSHS